MCLRLILRLSLRSFKLFLLLLVQFPHLSANSRIDESFRHVQLLSRMTNVDGTLYLVGNDCDTLCHIMDESLFGIWVAFLRANCMSGFISDEIHLILLQILLILCGCVLLCEAVGVVAIWQKEQLDVHTLCQKHINAAFACMYACIITIKNNRNIVCNSMNQANLFGRKSCSRRRYNILYPLLMHSHHIRITLHKIAEVCLANGLTRLEEAEKFLPLAINNAFGRV